MKSSPVDGAHAGTRRAPPLRAFPDRRGEDRMNAPRDLPNVALRAGTAGVRHVPSYCYQCVAGPDLLTVKVVDGVATEIEPNFCAADIHPGHGKVCVKAYGLVQKTYHPDRVATPMKRTNPAQGPRRGPGVRADLLGRGARSRRGQAARDPRRRRARRLRLSARGRVVRRRRHAAGLHGHVPRVPLGLRHDGHGLRLRAGRQVLPLRAPVRRVLAPRVHRRAGHPAHRIHHLVRHEHRGLRRRGGRGAPRRRARARHEARAGGAAPVGDRRVLRRVDPDQAEDRPRVPVRAAQHDARRPARAPGPPLPHRPHGLALPGRAARLLPARSGDAQAAACGRAHGRGGRVRHAGRRSPRSRAATRPTRSRSVPTTTCSPRVASPARRRSR